MKIQFGEMILVDSFDEGDIICHENNWNGGLPLFGKASNYDVENYSGRDERYIKLVPFSTSKESKETPIAQSINNGNVDKFLNSQIK